MIPLSLPSISKRKLHAVAGFIQSTFFFLVGFQLLFDNGNFDPNRSVFWRTLSIGAGVNLLMRLTTKHGEKYWENLERPLFRQIRMLRTFAFFSMLFMIIFPFGSFNPLTVGFYCCVILGGVITGLLRRYL